MSLSLDKIREIRDNFAGGMQKSEISRQCNVSRPTIDKYIDMSNFNDPENQIKKEETEGETGEIDEADMSNQKDDTILAPFIDIIVKLLTNDKREDRKMRLSNTRIFEILRDDYGYTGSRSTVDNKVRELRKELGVHKKKRAADGYLMLTHYPGEAQADFGKARFEENNMSHQGSFLSLSFPYSNARFIQLTYGETAECLFEGLKAFFDYLDGVPKEIWFDNASSIVKLLNNGKDRRIFERFKRFSAHYGFHYHFMNPASPWAKGNVENSVDYMRSHLLAPVKNFSSLKEKNEELFAKAETLLQQKHYRFGMLIEERFREDKEALLKLPSVPFDTSKVVVVSTNKCGIFTLEEGKHRYSSAPNYCDCSLQVKLTGGTVEVFSEKGELIVTHPRLYGGDGEMMEHMDYRPYLKYIARKPNSFRNMPIKEVMPTRLAEYIEQLPNNERGKLLTELANNTEEMGFMEAIDFLAEKLGLGDEDVPEETVEPKEIIDRIGDDFLDLEGSELNLEMYDDIL